MGVECRKRVGAVIAAGQRRRGAKVKLACRGVRAVTSMVACWDICMLADDQQCADTCLCIWWRMQAGLCMLLHCEVEGEVACS